MHWPTISLYPISGNDERLGLEERSHQVELTAVIGMVLGVPYGLYNLFFTPFATLGLVELLSVGLLVVPARFMAHRRSKPDLAENLVLLAGLLIFSALIAYRGADGTGPYWGFVFPFLAFFLKGSRKGYVYSLAFLVVVTVCFLLMRQGIYLGDRYPDRFGLHYVIILTSYIFIATGFSQLRARFEEKLHKQVDDRTATARSYLSQLQHQATHDVLTGLPNHPELTRQLEARLQQLHGTDLGLVVCSFHVLRHHELSNILGPDGTDAMILDIVRQLRQSIQDQGLLARTRRDEFVMALPTDSVQLEHRMLRRFMDHRELSMSVMDMPLRIELTLGISSYPQHGQDAATLIRQAEQAMLQARKDKLPWAVYDESQERLFQRHHLLFGRMVKALAERQFSLYFQPQLDLASGRVVGAEALTRWFCSEQETIPPSVFIPIAEESGLIEPLTEWLIDGCFVQLGRWKAVCPDLRLSINLSAKTLKSPTLIPYLRSGLALYGVDPTRVILEITESCFIDAPQRSLEIMNLLCEMGFRLSIDDFGTGFSSLSYLKDMPLSELKIDQSFIRNVRSAHGEQAIVTSIIELAHNLGLTVVAEGIEDESTCGWLRELHCDAGQGYLLARPMPCEAFLDWAAAALRAGGEGETHMPA